MKPLDQCARMRMRMLTKRLFGESETHTSERCQLVLTPCYFVPALTLYIPVEVINLDAL